MTDGVLSVTNLYDFVDLGHLAFLWTRGDSSGFLAVPPVDPGATVRSRCRPSRRATACSPCPR